MTGAMNVTWLDTSHDDVCPTERREAHAWGLKVIVFRPCYCSPMRLHECTKSAWSWTVNNAKWHATSTSQFATETEARKAALAFAKQNGTDTGILIRSCQ
jgi:hypothetical protein